MMSDGCYLGATFALGSAALNSQIASVSFGANDYQGKQLDNAQLRKAKNEVEMHRHLAINLTETCQFSTLTRTGLPANYLWINEPDRFLQRSDYFNEYHLRYSFIF